MVGQCLSTMLMLVSMHWFIFLLNLPVAAWNIYRYCQTIVFLLRIRIWHHLSWIGIYLGKKLETKWKFFDFFYSVLLVTLTCITHNAWWYISPFSEICSQSQNLSVGVLKIIQRLTTKNLGCTDTDTSIGWVLYSYSENMCRYHDIFPLFPFCGCYWFAEQQIIIIWIRVCDFLTSPSSHFKVCFFCFSILCSFPMVCVSAGTWRFRWGTWACLTPQRSITEASSSLIWKRPWLNWATICSASSFTCTGESIKTHRKKVQPEIVFFSHVMSCSSPPAWSWLWSTTEAHRTPQLSDHHPVQSAPTNLLVECNQISVQPAACAATNSTLWPSWSLEYLGQSTAVILTKKRSRQIAISQKRAKFLLSSLLLCRAVIF